MGKPSWACLHGAMPGYHLLRNIATIAPMFLRSACASSARVRRASAAWRAGDRGIITLSINRATSWDARSFNEKSRGMIGMDLASNGVCARRASLHICA